MLLGITGVPKTMSLSIQLICIKINSEFYEYPMVKK
jgi:hypothetical protein